MNRDRTITFIFLLLLMAFTSVDIALDLKEGLPLDHLVHELIILISSLLIVVYKIRIISKKNSQLKAYEDNSNQANAEIDFYKNKVKKYKNELNEIINQQFKIWGFTESEHDIAVLLIKGLSMKEISNIRGSGESTVRQQATSIYRKSQLENRNQLTAYFIEDLF